MQKHMRRQLGLLVPVSMLAGGHGIGTTAALIKVLDFCADHRIGAVGILPNGDSGFDPSPYSGIDIRALCPRHLHMEPGWIPGLTKEGHFLNDHPFLKKGLNSGSVNYPIVDGLNMTTLWRAFEQLETNCPPEEHEFVCRQRNFVTDNQDWLRVYTLFRVLMEQHHHCDFRQWPGATTYEQAERRLDELDSPERKAIQKNRAFHEYVQGVADHQWLIVKAHAERLGIQLFGDIPYSMSRRSTALWGPDRDLFWPDWSGGAPAEPEFVGNLFLALIGQNWGGLVPLWTEREKEVLAWWGRRIASHARYFHGFKFDHQLGLHRQWCLPLDPGPDQMLLELSRDEVLQLTGGHLPKFIPRGDDTVEDRELNRLEGRRRTAAIMAMARELGIDVFFEALGVVPDYVRPTLDELGAARIIIPHWEPLEGDDYPSMSGYPLNSVTMWGTHDQKPLRMSYEQMLKHKDEHRQRELRRMMRLINVQEAPASYTVALHTGFHGSLMRSSAHTVFFYAPSLFATEIDLNRPGTVQDCWTGRFDREFGDYVNDPIAGPFLLGLARLVEETGRDG